jgi:hypothetical protein
MKPAAQAKYEEDCLNNLHIRLLFQRATGKPISTLLLEPILAGCGATLSIHAFTLLGRLCKHHGITVILDEIMTGGRTGTLLMYEILPQEFKSVVGYITMGKWVGGGLLLCSKEQEVRFQLLSAPDISAARGNSTFMPCSQWVNRVKEVIKLLPNTAKHCAYIINGHRLEEADCWGSGVLIFSSIDRTGFHQGLTNRMLPLLSDSRLRAGISYRIKSAWKKDTLNQSIKKACLDWSVCHQEDIKYTEPFPGGSIDPAIKNLYPHIKALAKGVKLEQTAPPYIYYDEFKATYFNPKEMNYHIKTQGYLFKHKLLHLHRPDTRKKQMVIVNRIMLPPWTF